MPIVVSEWDLSLNILQMVWINWNVNASNDSFSKIKETWIFLRLTMKIRLITIKISLTTK